MRHGRRDANHRQIIDALESLLWKVKDTADLPKFVDCVVQRGHDTKLIEIKSDKGKLTKDQRKMIEKDGWIVHVIRSVADAEAL